MKFLFLGLLTGLIPAASLAQHLHAPDLLAISCMTPARFDSCMAHNGFTFCQRSEGINYMGSVYAYLQDTYLTNVTSASALINYICKKKVGTVIYQLHDRAHYQRLRVELTQLGFRWERPGADASPDWQIYTNGPVVVSLRPADGNNGIAGNYTGYSVMVRHTRDL